MHAEQNWAHLQRTWPALENVKVKFPIPLPNYMESNKWIGHYKKKKKKNTKGNIESSGNNTFAFIAEIYGMSFFFYH